jgi:molybdate transport system substrate-binding protein
MRTVLSLPRRVAAWLVGCTALIGAAQAADLKVAAPNAVKDAVTQIATRFERESGHRVVFVWGGSESVAKRVADGESFDVVVNTAANIDRFMGEGRLVSGTRADLARSGVGAAVRAGLPRPDISSVDALRQALLAANTIAISSGASGRHLEQVFQRLGVADQVRAKLKQPPSGAQIGELMARGEADLGFQQANELLHAKGIDYLGPLPPELQHFTVWSAARHAGAADADAATAFLRALVAPASAAVVRAEGMEAP